MTRSNQRLWGTRTTLFVSTLALTALGVLFVHSTRGGGDFPNLSARLQLLKGFVGLAVFVMVSRLDYRVLDRFAYVLYGGFIVVLIGLLIAPTDDSTKRFIKLPYFHLQPSELMKIVLVLALARYLRYREDQRKLTGLLVPFALAVVPMLLVLKQPDLGTSLMFPPILLATLFVAGAKSRHILVAITLGVSLLLGAYFAHTKGLTVTHEYQMRRLEAWMHQDYDLNNLNYQLDQSKIAIGSGGLTGKGLGEGTQNQFNFLPARHTDFIFSIIAEEWGFIGASATVILILIMVIAILRIAMNTREPIGRLIAAGIGVQFAAQSFQNIAMTMGITPITGLPLPFVSYGGSSLVTSFLAVGIVFSIARRRVQVMASSDLNPQDTPRQVSVVDDKAAGLLDHRWAPH